MITRGHSVVLLLKRITFKMRLLVLLAAVAGLAAAGTTGKYPPVECNLALTDSVYNYSTTLLNGSTVQFSQLLKNRNAVFIPSTNYDARAAVNQVAAKEKAESAPDVIFIMFSTSQFGFGEVFTKPSEFMNVLKHVRPGDGFVPPTNMLYTKTADINGIHGTPVFTNYLTRACGYTRPEFRTDITNHLDASNCSKTNPAINFINDVRNPFEAFSINSVGQVTHRYDAVTDLDDDFLLNMSKP